MIFRIKKVHPDAVIPSYAHGGDAGFDLRSTEDILLERGKPTAIPIGINIEIPEGHTALIWDRSGLAFNHGIKSLGGVIDTGFRGEVKVCLINLGQEDYEIKKGERVAQMIIQKYEKVDIEEAKELSDGERGSNGFGSTGKD
ncbi:MAG: dUTP diphosphatase [Candidatus Paceibacterota bacterium]|jgi:dUTP pyrophosphatase